MPWSHQPAGYACPFCRMQSGLSDELNQPSDVVAVTQHAFARISPAHLRLCVVGDAVADRGPRRSPQDVRPGTLTP